MKDESYTDTESNCRLGKEASITETHFVACFSIVCRLDSKKKETRGAHTHTERKSERESCEKEGEQNKKKEKRDTRIAMRIYILTLNT